MASPQCLSPLLNAWGGGSPGHRRTSVPWQGSSRLSTVRPAGFGLPGEAAALRIPEEEADAHQGADPGVRPRRPRQRRLFLSLRTGRYRRRGTMTPGETPGAGCWGGGGDAAGMHPEPTQPLHPPGHGEQTHGLLVLGSSGCFVSQGASWVWGPLGAALGAGWVLPVPAWEPSPGCAPTLPHVNWGGRGGTHPGAVGATAAELARTGFNKTR